MRINQIHLKNFRCYEDVSIEFHPRFNVLVGINGTGKTSGNKRYWKDFYS